MRLIFINRFFYPDHSATSQMLSDLAFGLAKRGRSVRIITSRQRYDDASVVLPPRETFDGVDIVRVWTTRFGRSGLLGRAIDYLTFYLSAAIALLRLATRNDVVIAKTDPPMLSVIVAPICALKGARSVNWLQDLFPEVAKALGVAGVISSSFGFLATLRNWSLRRATRNVAIGNLMSRRLQDLGAQKNDIRIIPNWADGAEIKPIPPDANALRHAWGLDGNFVVGYSGNFGRAHDYLTLLSAMQMLSASSAEGCRDGSIDEPAVARRPVSWLFVGGGKNYDALQQAAHQQSISAATFQPYQPRAQLSESLSAADVHIVSLYPALEGLIVPSKFYGIAAVGRPTIFIGDPDGEIATLIRRHECGLCVREGDGAGLAQAVLSLARDPGRCAEMGARVRRLFDASFDKSIAIDAWEAVFAELE